MQAWLIGWRHKTNRWCKIQRTLGLRTKQWRTSCDFCRVISRQKKLSRTRFMVIYLSLHLYFTFLRKTVRKKIWKFRRISTLSNHDGNKHPICILDNEKQYLCTLCTCIFHLLIFWSCFRSFYDVKWPVLQLCGQMTNVQMLSSYVPSAGSRSPDIFWHGLHGLGRLNHQPQREHCFHFPEQL